MLTKWTPGSRPAENESQARYPYLWRGLSLAIYPTLTGGGGSTLKTFGKKAFRPSLLNGTYSWTYTPQGRSFHPDGTDGYLDTQDSSFTNEMDKEGFSVAMHFDMFGASMANAERWWGAGESDTQPGVFLRVISPSGTTSILRMQVEDDAGVQERINTSEAMEMGDGPHCWLARYNWSAESYEIYWDSVLESADDTVMSGTIGSVAGASKSIYIGGHNNNGSLLQPMSAGFIMWAWYSRQLSRREISLLGRDPFAIVRRRSR